MCYYVYAAECYELSLKFTFLLVEYCSANVYLNKEFRNELKVITICIHLCIRWGGWVKLKIIEDGPWRQRHGDGFLFFGIV